MCRRVFASAGADFRLILRDLDGQDSLEMMAEMDFDLSRVRKLKNTHTKGILVDNDAGRTLYA